jgi:hypothetical protein
MFPVRELEQVLQVALRDIEQRRTDHRAVKRAHAADDDDQQHVDHDVEGQRGAGPVVAQPERVEDAGQGGEQGRQHGGQAAVGDVAVADRLAAEIVVADRHQDAAERRIDDAQHEQEEAARTQHHQVIGDQLAVQIGAEEFFVGQGEGRRNELRDLEVEPVLAAGPVRELRSHGHEGGGDGQRDHGEENRPYAQGEQADAQREDGGQDHRDQQAHRHRGPGRSHLGRRDADPVGTDAEEHGVGEGNDAGIAQHQVVTGRQHDEHRDLGADVHGTGTGKNEGRRQQADDDDEQQQRAQQFAARQVRDKRLESMSVS